MTSTGIDSLDRSVHHANAWLGELAEELGGDRRAAYRVMRTFLHLLRDELTVEEGAHLAAQLPLLWRGVFYEGWTPGRTNHRLRSREAFLRHLADHAQLAGTTEASLAADACAVVLRAHVSEGELEDVFSVLPASLTELLTARR